MMTTTTTTMSRQSSQTHKTTNHQRERVGVIVVPLTFSLHRSRVAVPQSELHHIPRFTFIHKFIYQFIFSAILA